MAGKPGMKGGGGARPGAGRKKRAPASGEAVAVTLESQPHGERAKSKPVPIKACDMLTLLQDVALGRTDATPLQVRAAIAAVQYTHVKKGDGGKKDEQAERAKKAGAGIFAPTAPPKLSVVKK